MGNTHIVKKKKKVPESVRGKRGRFVPEALREEILGYLDEASAQGISESRTCKYLELNRKTIQNWRTTCIQDKRKGSARLVPHKFSEAEEQAFYDAAMTKRFADRTPEQIVATLAEEGLSYGSPSTLYRILRKRNLPTIEQVLKACTQQ